MAMKTTAMTPKFWKFATNEVKMKRMPSIVSRLLTGIVSSRIANWTFEYSLPCGGTCDCTSVVS